MAPFGSWVMPIFYQSVIFEHNYVRSQVGIFDVSHMGEIFVQGKDASSFLQGLTINNIDKLKVGSSQYTALCNEKGGIIDDLIIYRIFDQTYLLCVNAANIAKDFSWLQSHQQGFLDLSLTNRSSDFGQIAIQGPLSLKLLNTVFSAEKIDFSQLSYGQIIEVELFGLKVFFARTGYTGEMGFEAYLPLSLVGSLWDLLLACPHPKALPIGLGARDTLRLEAGFILYGNDANDQTTPMEVGIGWACRLLEKDFIGKDAILEAKKRGLERKIEGFIMDEQAIPRANMTLWQDDKEIGLVTSGSYLPSLQKAGGLALVSCKANIEKPIFVDVRGQLKKACIVKKPLYVSKSKTS